MNSTTKPPVALVTGGSRGIGRGIALKLAHAGYDVAITYANEPEDAAGVVALIKQQGRAAMAVRGELTLSETPQQIVDACLAEFGQIDLLVNNAGRTIFGSVLEMDLETIDTLMSLDFRSYVLMTQCVARQMVAANIPGSIINITSTRGDRAYAGDGVYGGMKAALSRAAASFALDLAPHGIRVNCVAPGCVPSQRMLSSARHQAALEDFRDRIPMKRFGTADDIANAVVWLASSQASYITGQTLNVDGGLILPGMREIEPAAGG